MLEAFETALVGIIRFFKWVLVIDCVVAMFLWLPLHLSGAIDATPMDGFMWCFVAIGFVATAYLATRMVARVRASAIAAVSETEAIVAAAQAWDAGNAVRIAAVWRACGVPATAANLGAPA